MQFSPLIVDLIDALRGLPGVGPKSAQRMAMYLLERDRPGAQRLARALQAAVDGVGHCRRCRTLTEYELCAVCSSPRRDASKLCVVEMPADAMAIEQSGGFQGLYFVLLGRLSPLEGVGPGDLGIDQLVRRVRDEGVEELILATNPTVEGDATAFFISEQLKGGGVEISRIAHGVPLGGELEYVDAGTLAHAFSGRKRV